MSPHKYERRAFWAHHYRVIRTEYFFDRARAQVPTNKGVFGDSGKGANPQRKNTYI